MDLATGHGRPQGVQVRIDRDDPFLVVAAQRRDALDPGLDGSHRVRAVEAAEHPVHEGHAQFLSAGLGAKRRPRNRQEQRAEGGPASAAAAPAPAAGSGRVLRVMEKPGHDAVCYPPIGHRTGYGATLGGMGCNGAD